MEKKFVGGVSTLERNVLSVVPKQLDFTRIKA
jgi:hypothetical protein